MKRVVCAIFDTATRLYGQPFMVPAPGAALRMFGDEVNRSAADNAAFNHPEDFELYVLATFDDETGVYESTGIERLARGKDMRIES